MAEIDPDPISIPEKILQTLFLNLEGQEGFDQDIIAELKVLAGKDQLGDAESITAILKNEKGDNNASH